LSCAKSRMQAEGAHTQASCRTRPQIMKSARFQELVLWAHFDQRRTREAGGRIDSRLHGIVSSTLPAGTSRREHVERLIREASEPFSAVYISPLLDQGRSIRGATYFGYAGRQIDQIVDDYPGMRWWITKGGLVIDVVPDEADRLSEFDRRAGQLVCDGTQAGRLFEDVVRKIAAELDAAGFSLLENLQPAQRKPIAAFNQKYAKRAVKSFSAAASHREFSRAVRRRLYVARDRYRAAYKSTPS
jgi:hypothetical protein